MLSQHEFSVLRAVAEGHGGTQRALAQACTLSLGAVNKAVRALREKHLLSEHDLITDQGLLTLEPYTVEHAVILAAGLSTRLAPLSYEHPKALFTVQGEVLIERLIRQLRNAGIPQISVVVGHMKEQLFYLEDKFGITLVETDDYLIRNNHSSVLCAASFLQNAYLCSSDQFYEASPFHRWENGSWVSVVQGLADNRETPLRIDSKGRVASRDIRQSDDSWYMMGPAFLDQGDGARLVELIELDYDLPGTKEKLWEDVLLDHIRAFNIYAKPLPKEAIFEFDRMEDLCSFDAAFLENVDSAILDNICRTLDCDRSDILDVEPLTKGLTNLSVVFSCKGERFVYRHPGAGTDELVNREAEAFALKAAHSLGLDSTFVYEEPAEGWKISRYIPNCLPFDYGNSSHVSRALEKIRRLHDSEESSPWSFDFYEESQRIAKLLRSENAPIPHDFGTMEAMIGKLAEPMRLGRGRPVLCHNDFYGPNILIHDESICLIDWEYAAMGDYGCDLGNFIAQGSGYSVDEALAVLPFYFGRPPTKAEAAHILMCTAIVGWYWYVWALYKEHSGSSTGSWIRAWYSAAKQFGEAAMDTIVNQPNDIGSLSEEQFNALVNLEQDSSAFIEPSILSGLGSLGLVDDGGITAAGLAALEPYRAKRAIFFAAGFGSRMLPVTLNTPKPLVRVWGTRIIDRLLDAVSSIGIEEIYVVRGYLKDEFDQLRAKYPTITFVDNPLYDSTNNISSALAVKDLFQNAYAFESDLLLANPNLITKYNYTSNYLAIPVDQTPDWCFDVNGEGVICSIAKGSEKPCWQMVGASYWNAADGKQLAQDLPEVFNSNPEARQIFWDDVALDRKPQNYKVRIRECNSDDIVEIDTFEELQELDAAYRTGGEGR